MDKLIIWIANIVSEDAVRDAKEAWRVVMVIVVVLLIAALVHELARDNPMPMEDIPSNALAQ